jgi:hypothetical protein
MLRASSEAGERHSGRGDQKTGSEDATPKLSDLGITKQQSSDFQRLADVPDADFEAALADTTLGNEVITGNGL